MNSEQLVDRCVKILRTKKMRPQEVIEQVLTDAWDHLDDAVKRDLARSGLVQRVGARHSMGRQYATAAPVTPTHADKLATLTVKMGEKVGKAANSN